jgi:hypothetical protein
MDKPAVETASTKALNRPSPVQFLVCEGRLRELVAANLFAGLSLAGLSLAGLSLAGLSLAGLSLAGLSLAGLSLAGLSLAGLSIFTRSPKERLKMAVLQPRRGFVL